jgi:hypothetical protein
MARSPGRRAVNLFKLFRRARPEPVKWVPLSAAERWTETERARRAHYLRINVDHVLEAGSTAIDEPVGDGEVHKS